MASLPRITARVDDEVQALLSRAAALTGISSINSFVLNAAIEKAKAVIREEELLKLNAEDAKAFVEAIERPAEANEELREAFRAYKDKAH